MIPYGPLGRIVRPNAFPVTRIATFKKVQMIADIKRNDYVVEWTMLIQVSKAPFVIRTRTDVDRLLFSFVLQRIWLVQRDVQ